MALNEDRALLEAFRAGAPAALTRVYREHVDLVFRVLMRGFVLDAHGHKRVPGVGDRERAQEMAQEVFARAFSTKARAAYDGISPYRPYVMRICKNLMIDELRKAGREVASPDVDIGVDDELVSEAEQSLDGRKLLSATEAFVATLTEPEKTLYALRYQQSLGQREVAEKMGVSRKRVRTIEAKLRDALYDHLRTAGLGDALKELV